MKDKKMEERFRKTVYTSGVYDERNEWITKIEEKIEELRKLQVQYIKDCQEGRITKPNTVYKYLKTSADQIEVLEELLDNV